MSFILLRRTSDGEIHLLSNTAWSGRGDAMAELSRITAAPSFDRWDDEVLLVDVDSGTPILMVRPAAPEPEVAHSDDDASDAEDAAADDAEEVAADTDEGSAPSAPPTDEEIAALLEDLDAPEVSPTAAPSLKEALERSAARLESEGIVAPDSIGPALEPSPVEVDDAVEPETEVDEAPAAWPWDTAGEEKKFDLDALEESHLESESLVRAPGDDETLSIAKPVILGGEYTDTAPEVVPATDADAAGSDFIDLGPAEQAAPAPMVSQELEALTCADCVYDATCPNRGQLLPASCGSFQWK